MSSPSNPLIPSSSPSLEATVPSEPEEASAPAAEAVPTPAEPSEPAEEPLPSLKSVSQSRSQSQSSSESQPQQKQQSQQEKQAPEAPLLPPKVPVKAPSSSAASAPASMKAAPFPSRPIPFNGREGRDVSSSSIDGLRRQIKERQSILTTGEHAFLEQLLVVGNEIEVQLAIEKLSDSELFFETTTTDQNHQKKNNNGNVAKTDAVVDNTDDDSDDYGRVSDDATRDNDGEPPRQTTNKSTTSKKGTRSRFLSDSSIGTEGSLRRQESLRLRRSGNTLHDQMWKAHETGLGITKQASTRSLMVRQLSVSSSVNMSMRGGRGPLQSSSPSPPPPFDSSASTIRAASPTLIFRAKPSAKEKKPVPEQTQPQTTTTTTTQTTTTTTATNRPPLPAPVRFGSSPVIAVDRDSNTNDNNREISNLTVDSGGGLVDGGSAGGRPRSRSVTFSKCTKEATCSSGAAASASGIPGNNNDNNNPKIMKRSLSLGSRPMAFQRYQQRSESGGSVNSAGILMPAGPQLPNSNNATNSARVLSPFSSISSIPSIHRATAIRSDSMSLSSIPAIHPATAIRSDSIMSVLSSTPGVPRHINSPSSIPGIHQAHHVWDRQNSTASYFSTPSIHQANQVWDRRDSTASNFSIPSIHQANHVWDRRDSTASNFSIPSIHQAHHVWDRRDSTASNFSIPSILHARHVWDRRDSSNVSLSEFDHSNNDDDHLFNYYNGQEQPSYVVDDQVAKQWLAFSAVSSNNNINNETNDNATSNKNDDTTPLNVSTPLGTKETKDDQNDKIPAGGTEETKENYNDNAQETAEGKDATTTITTTTPIPSVNNVNKVVLMRLASRNEYEGQGVEVTPIANNENTKQQHRTSYTSFGGDMTLRRVVSNDDAASRRSSSFMTQNEKQQYEKQWNDIFRSDFKSISAEDGVLFHSNNKLPFYIGANQTIVQGEPPQSDNSNNNASNNIYISKNDLGESWDMDETETSAQYPEHELQCNTWNVMKDDYVFGPRGTDASFFLSTLADFRILGTSVYDDAAKPHVLSPPMMESLKAFVPYGISSENFYLKYSLVRDGASMHTFLMNARAAKYTILAIETLEGEVFGSFTGSPWRKSMEYFGTGECFLWKMRRNRVKGQCSSILEQAQVESEIDVFPYRQHDNYIQLCTEQHIAIGGGGVKGKDNNNNNTAAAAVFESGSPRSTIMSEKKDEHDHKRYFGGDDEEASAVFNNHEYGFGLHISTDNFLEGTSSPTTTFDNPPLSAKHADGSAFEILNMELWTFTPCWNEAEADKLASAKLFLTQNI